MSFRQEFLNALEVTVLTYENSSDPNCLDWLKAHEIKWLSANPDNNGHSSSHILDLLPLAHS